MGETVDSGTMEGNAGIRNLCFFLPFLCNSAQRAHLLSLFPSRLLNFGPRAHPLSFCRRLVGCAGVPDSAPEGAGQRRGGWGEHCGVGDGMDTKQSKAPLEEGKPSLTMAEAFVRLPLEHLHEYFVCPFCDQITECAALPTVGPLSPPRGALSATTPLYAVEILNENAERR